MSRSFGSCQNVSCSLKAVVDVPPTKIHAEAEAPSSVVQPCTMPTLAASGGLAGNKFFDVSFFRQQVQEAHNILETEIPYAISAKLLPMLNHCPGSALPATLQMIRKPGAAVGTPYMYTKPVVVEYIPPPLPLELAKVAYQTMLHPCSQAAVLVVSTQKSSISRTSADGYKVVTDNVVDLLRTEADEECDASPKYQIISFARLDDLMEFKLDPPRKHKDQAALITVTGVFDADADGAERPVKKFLAEDVQLLTPEEANTLKVMFRNLLYFATLDDLNDRKRKREH